MHIGTIVLDDITIMFLPVLVLESKILKCVSLNFRTLHNNEIDTLKCYNTSMCMHGMNQTEAEYPRHNKRS